MNIFGVGPAELVIIFLILMVVAGPKRMVQWAYIIGHWIGKARAMMAEASQVIKKELEEAGVDPEITDTVTKFTSNVQSMRPRAAVNNMIQTFTEPLSEAMGDVGDTPLDPRPNNKSQARSRPHGLKNDDNAATEPAEQLEPASESPDGDPPVAARSQFFAQPQPEAETTGNDISSPEPSEALEPTSESSDGDTPRQYDAWTPN